MEAFYTDEQGSRWTDQNGLWVEEQSPCGWCGKPTHRVDIDFQAPVHYDDCLNSLWKEYWEACRAPIDLSHGGL